MAFGLGLALLAGCGGGGGDAAPNTGGGTARNQLFVSEITQGRVAMFPVVDPAPGSTLAVQSSLRISNMDGSLAYDSGRDLLYAGSGASVLVYASASKLADGALPTRSLVLPAGVQRVTGLQLDEARDVLYVGGARTYDGQVLVFDNASAASGAAAPTRTMTINDGVNAFAIDVDRAILYAGSAITGVHVYTGIATANGILTANRSMLGSSTVDEIALDAGRDRLYVADVFTGVDIVAGASTAAPTTGTRLAIPNARVVAVDAANDRLYVGAYDKAYLFARASTLGSSTSAPAAAVTGPAGTSIGAFAFP